MNTQLKIRIKKRGWWWEVECPHCPKQFGTTRILHSFTDAVALTSVHLGAHYSTHRPYVIWSRSTGGPVAHCYDCKWTTKTITAVTPFQAADRHLRGSK